MYLHFLEMNKEYINRKFCHVIMKLMYFLLDPKIRSCILVLWNK